MLPTKIAGSLCYERVWRYESNILPRREQAGKCSLDLSSDIVINVETLSNGQCRRVYRDLAIFRRFKNPLDEDNLFVSTGRQWRVDRNLCHVDEAARIEIETTRRHRAEPSR